MSNTHALLAMLATAIFDHLFIKSNISAMDTLVGFAENSTGGCYGDYKNSLKTMKQKVQ